MERKPRCPRCNRGTDLRGFIAVLGIVLVFALAFYRSAQGVAEGDIVPPWAAGFLVLVTNGYYMTKGSEKHAEALRRAEDPTGRAGSLEVGDRQPTDVGGSA